MVDDQPQMTQQQRDALIDQLLRVKVDSLSYEQLQGYARQVLESNYMDYSDDELFEETLTLLNTIN
jgi:hypothetical protein